MRFSPALLLVLLLGVECGPVTVPVNPDLFNTCTGDSDCLKYCGPNAELCAPTLGKPTCVTTASGAQACVFEGTSSLEFELIVDVPLGVQYAPGQTFLLTQGSISAVQHANANACSPMTSPPCCQQLQVPHHACIPLPVLEGPQPPGDGDLKGGLNTSGAYEVTSSFVSDLQAVNGSTCDHCSALGLSSTNFVTLPVQATLTPQWMLGTTPFPAALAGLPMPVITGSIVQPFAFDNLGSSPFGSESVGWETFAFEPTQLVNTNLTYSQALEVLPPFEFVPPVILDKLFDFDPWIPSGTDPVSTPVCVTFPVGTKTEGWTVFFREAYQQRVLSSTATLEKKPGTPIPSFDCNGNMGTVPFDVPIFSFFPDLPEAETEPVPPVIVVSPPKGPVAPALIETFQPGIPEAYPPLPPPVKLTGRVLHAGTPTPAELHFVSQSNQSIYAVVNERCATYPHLFYDTVVATDPANVGEYSVTLPWGEYTVTVNPDSSDSAPQAISTLTMSLSDCAASKPGITADFETGNAIGVSGTVTIPGGASGGLAVPNAFVDLTPSLPALSLVPPVIPVSPIDLPRSFEVRTDANGRFSFSPAVQAAVGPGLYDITVRPPDGTALPWVVSHALQISKDTKTTFAITVPAPAPLTLTLHDPENDQPVVDALVRAYAFPSCSAFPCPGAIQIGEALTDSTGFFQMFLAPSPFQAGVQ